MLFNEKVKAVVDRFNTKFSADSSKFIFIIIEDAIYMVLLLISGFRVLNAPCCPSGENGQCVEDKTACQNRKEYVFSDEFHPTEAANQIIAITSYNASNINHLLHSTEFTGIPAIYTHSSSFSTSITCSLSPTSCTINFFNLTRDMQTSWLVLSVFLLAAINCMHGHGEPQVPCLFIFGDSQSDSGNNNDLPTSAKSNYKPYGIDFPEVPSGRFTNGRTAIDITSQLLGFEKFIPPYANIGGSDILKGVNYASGAAGIRIETGTHMGVDISLGLQLANHERIVSEIAIKLGGYEKAVKYLNKCLYYVNIGNNDYINNYFLPNLYPTSRIYSRERYAQVLIDQLSLHIQGLHDVGARKYIMVGAGLIGCTPNAIFTHNESSCVEEMNVAAFIFNDKLKALVDQFNTRFSSDSQFIFINSTFGALDSSLGFKVLDAPCCPSERNGQCVPNEVPCQNRKEYVFWDEFHTTEAANMIVAITSYNASNEAFTYPMDIQHLVDHSPLISSI
ncbi:hypothetical protein RJT34_13936 [Clitoria ternatea]|uniref:Uncharacterized protein n=1 Tax=Clitoria ternatea TaxID=43366 RepID=A0AAN9JSF1_CLITE